MYFDLGWVKQKRNLKKFRFLLKVRMATFS